MSTVQNKLSQVILRQQNRGPYRFGARSAENRNAGFLPAFLDPTSGRSYLSRYADGSLAPFHLLDGLPAELLSQRRDKRHARRTRRPMIAGFLLGDRFYTREQAAATLGSMQAAA